MLITKNIERIAGPTMEISEITRRVLHLNWIMQTNPDFEDEDLAVRDDMETRWKDDVVFQEEQLAKELESELTENRKQLSGLLFNFIHENDLENEPQFKQLKAEMKTASSEQLLKSQIDTALAVAEKGNCKWFREKIDFGDLRERIGSENDNTFSGRILSKAQLLILIKLFIRAAYKDDFVIAPLELETEIWQKGGIQEFKKRRKDLAKRIKGQERAKYVKDSIQWDKAMNKVLHSRLVAIRGFGGYGKTTLVREIVYYLISRESKWNFSHYYLYSFKTDNQGDLGPDGEKQKPDTGMEHQDSKFESVINELYFKITKLLPRGQTLEDKRKEVIKHLSAESCLLVLDNYEDIDAVKGMEGEKKLFEDFFEELKYEIRGERQNTCIIVTTRSSELASKVQFMELNLGKDARITNATAKEILKSYLRKLFTDSDVDTKQKLDNALTSVSDEWENFVLGKKIPSNFGHTQDEIADIVRFPTVTEHLAYVMYSKEYTFSQAIEGFCKALKGQNQSDGATADKIINYVVSRSHDLLFDKEEERTILQKLIHEIGSDSHSIGMWHRVIADTGITENNILEKLLKTGFILPESQSMTDEYKFPLLVYSFLVKTYQVGTIKTQNQPEAWEILNTEFEDLQKTLSSIEAISKTENYSKLTEFGTANAINNTIQQLDSLTSEQCKAWLKLNEYAETTDRMSVTNLDSKISAVMMMLKYDDIEPDFYLNTMTSLILQIGSGIRDDEQCNFLINWCKKIGKAKQFKFEEQYNTGDCITIPGEVKSPTIDQIPGRITIKSSPQTHAHFEVIDGESWNPIKHALLILEQSRPDVFRVKLIPLTKEDAEPVEELNSVDEAKEIFDVIENKKLIGPRMDSGLHYLQHLNHYLHKRITLERLEQVLRDDERFEVVNNTGIDKLWLARKKPDVGNWKAITNVLGIPQNPLTYALAIRMTAIKAKSNAFVEVHLNNDFNDEIREKILELDIEPANVLAGLRPEIKRLFNYILLKSDSDDKGYLAYRSTITINKFEKKIIDTLGTEMINALGTKAKKDKAPKNYKNMKIDLFQAIEKSMKDERILHMAAIYDAELNKKPEEIDEEEPEELEEETEEVEELTNEDKDILTSIVECLRDSADKGITVAEALEVMKNELDYGKNKCNLIVKHLGDRKDTFDLEDVKIAIKKTLKDEKSVKKLSLSTTISSESDFENIWNEMI